MYIFIGSINTSDSDSNSFINRPTPVSIVQQLCQSSNSCVNPPTAVSIIQELCQSSKSCVNPPTAVSILQQLCQSSNSCVNPPTAVSILQQLCQSSNSCGNHPTAVSMIIVAAKTSIIAMMRCFVFLSTMHIGQMMRKKAPINNMDINAFIWMDPTLLRCSMPSM